MEFSRQEFWSGLPFLPPGDLPDPGIEPKSLGLQADSLPLEPPGKSCCLAVTHIHFARQPFPSFGMQLYIEHGAV